MSNEPTKVVPRPSQDWQIAKEGLIKVERRYQCKESFWGPLRSSYDVEEVDQFTALRERVYLRSNYRLDEWFWWNFLKGPLKQKKVSM